ncbi:unnamed protein product [Somion occarium]|uniref:Uncharacterized protein n=1 Tax=Somion occarium TaxID=3059160 RepID=A0ABP1CPW5_9APHY
MKPTRIVLTNVPTPIHIYTPNEALRYSRFKAFLRFSIPPPPGAAPRLTALLDAVTATLVLFVFAATFEVESPGPSGDGDVRRVALFSDESEEAESEFESVLDAEN